MNPIDRELQCRLVARHAERGWPGFRTTLLNAAYIMGKSVKDGHLTKAAATAKLTDAIKVAHRTPNGDDLRWIDQGINDGMGVTHPVKDEDLGRMVNDICNESDELGGFVVKWEDLPGTDKEVAIRIGRVVYDAGFQAGADSVKQ